MLTMRTAIVTLLTLSLVPLGLASASAEDLTVNDILQMWAERQAELKSPEIHWIEKVSERQSQPSSELREKTTKCSLWFGVGPRVRHERDTATNWKGLGSSLARPGLVISTFDGARNASYTSAAGPDDHHRAIEFDAPIYDDLPLYHIHPIVFYCRPLLVVPVSFSSRDHIVATPVELKIIEQNTVLDGTTCLIIESVSNDPSRSTDRYWIDASKRGLILKHVASSAGGSKTELRIKYKNHPKHGWMPSLWHGEFLGSSFDGIVTKVSLEGAFEEDERFVIDYPPGTVVFDQDQLQQRRVKKDGTTELIGPTP